jgi:hypothetical protein
MHELSNQVVLEKYGETNERRPLYVSYISSAVKFFFDT